MKQLIECSTCGYPLTPEEREGLVEIDGKMCKPQKSQIREAALMALEAWEPSDTAHRPGGLQQDFTKHEVESFDDWSGWVNPDPEQYFMKCCDCGLVHEMQFKVAKYSEGDKCEFVADADLQAVFRARRTTPPQRKPLTDDEIDGLMADTWGGACIAPQSAPAFARAIERAHGIGGKE